MCDKIKEQIHSDLFRFSFTVSISMKRNRNLGGTLAPEIGMMTSLSKWQRIIQVLSKT